MSSEIWIAVISASLVGGGVIFIGVISEIHRYYSLRWVEACRLFVTDSAIELRRIGQPTDDYSSLGGEDKGGEHSIDLTEREILEEERGEATKEQVEEGFNGWETWWKKAGREPVSAFYPSLYEARIMVAAACRETGREIAAVLESAGYKQLRVACEPRMIRYQRSRWNPQLILLDLDMEDEDPLRILRDLKEGDDEDTQPSVLVLASSEVESRRRQVLEAGAEGMIRKPVDALELALEVRSHLMIRALSRPATGESQALEDADREVARAQIGVLHILARLVEYRDFKTERHSERVGELAARIAAEMGLEEDEVEMIRDAAPLHDVGMVVVPDHILLKEGELTDKERRIMMTHAANGARILAESELPVMQLASTIAHTHHERWDGEGYPRGLKGDDIPVPGRIVAVADAFEAITHDRPFREAESAERALEEIVNERGRQFDPDVVDAFVRVLRRRLLGVGEC